MTDYHQLENWTDEELDEEIKNTFEMYDVSTWCTLDTDDLVFSYLCYLDSIVVAREGKWFRCFKCRFRKRCADEWTCYACVNG